MYRKVKAHIIFIPLNYCEKVLRVLSAQVLDEVNAILHDGVNPSNVVNVLA